MGATASGRSRLGTLVAALDARGVAYALGGGPAFRAWGVPDPESPAVVHLFTDEGAGHGLGGLLREHGFDPPPAAALARAPGVRAFAGRVSIGRGSGGAEEAERTRVKRTLDGADAWVLAAEALAALAVLGPRASEWRDTEALVARLGWRLDDGEVRRLLACERAAADVVERWDATVRRRFG